MELPNTSLQAVELNPSCLGQAHPNRPGTGPVYKIPILSGIQPTELCQLKATLSLAYHEFLDPDHILYGLLSWSSDAHQERLRSRHPFVPVVWNLLNNLTELGICTSEWINHKWDVEYCENSFTNNSRCQVQ